MDFPLTDVMPCFINPWSRYSVGYEARTHGALAAEGSAAWPAANRALYIPFTVTSPYPVRRMWAGNGATASGNIDLGIYSSGGRRLASTGATAQAGTSTLQYVACDILLDPDMYYMALSLSSATGTIRRSAALGVEVLRSIGMLQEASAHPLPASMTGATIATAYFPLFGLTSTPSGF